MSSYRPRRFRVEVDRVTEDDRGKRYVVLHLCGPELMWRNPEASRRWRLWWDAECPPMVFVRGILFGRAFLVEAVVRPS